MRTFSQTWEHVEGYYYKQPVERLDGKRWDECTKWEQENWHRLSQLYSHKEPPSKRKPVWVAPHDPQQMALVRALVLHIAGEIGISMSYWEGYENVEERYVNGKWQAERRPQVAETNLN